MTAFPPPSSDPTSTSMGGPKRVALWLVIGTVIGAACLVVVALVFGRDAVAPPAPDREQRTTTPAMDWQVARAEGEVDGRTYRYHARIPPGWLADRQNLGAAGGEPAQPEIALIDAFGGRITVTNAAVADGTGGEPRRREVLEVDGLRLVVELHGEDDAQLDRWEAAFEAFLGSVTVDES